MATLLVDSRAVDLPSSHSDAAALWVRLAGLEPAGWELKPEGLCQDDICVPLPGLRAAGLIRDEDIDFAGFLRHMGRPVVHDSESDTWATGPAASERSEALRSLKAPDFELPDLQGKRHRLSDYRGRRIFLVSWASW
jgi:hypothetical protein